MCFPGVCMEGVVIQAIVVACVGVKVSLLVMWKILNFFLSFCIIKKEGEDTGCTSQFYCWMLLILYFSMATCAYFIFQRMTSSSSSPSLLNDSAKPYTGHGKIWSCVCVPVCPSVCVCVPVCVILKAIWTL